ncbi:MAG: hypothetical protein ACM3PU_15380 [Gemmatimonadota bacterium]
MGRLSTSTQAHALGALAAATYLAVWWWLLPDVADQVADSGHDFGWLLLSLFVGVVVSYTVIAGAVVAVRRLTKPKRRRPGQQGGR